MRIMKSNPRGRRVRRASASDSGRHRHRRRRSLLASLPLPLPLLLVATATSSSRASFRGGGGSIAHALSAHSISFPLTREYSAEHGRSLARSFDAVVDSTEYFVRTTTGEGKVRVGEEEEEEEEENAADDDRTGGECAMPIFGDDVRITFGPRRSTMKKPRSRRGGGTDDGTTGAPVPTEYVLRVDGDAVSDSDFGWICTKFFECREGFAGIDTAGLRRAVTDHMNGQPPHPGYDARAAAADAAARDAVRALFEGGSALTQLEEDGFAIIDSAPKTTQRSNDRLSDFVVGGTGQERSRTDTVSFLDRDDAVSCGVEAQFDLLLGITPYLNDHLHVPASPHEPLAPGTRDRPLSNPSHIQAAEYGMGDYYNAHSDNSLAAAAGGGGGEGMGGGGGGGNGVRSNYRCYTCILYCNEGWTEEDGGALRLYRDSSDLLVPADAMERCSHLDVNPVNGRLLIFDSRLVHSVERVTQGERARRALTLWILRPEDSGARGEVYYLDDDES